MSEWMVNTGTEAVTKLLHGVTSGPWEYIIGHSDWGLTRSNAVVPVGMSEFDFDDMIAEVHSATPYCSGSSRKDRERSATADANARFIAAARDLVPALLAERDALKAEVERMKSQPTTVHDAAKVDAGEEDDGRPCVTDVFLAAAIDQLKDKWDFFEAVKDWCKGDWDGALEGVNIHNLHAITEYDK